MSHQPQELQRRRRASGRLPTDRRPQPHEPAQPGLDLAPARLDLAQAVHDLEPPVLDHASLRQDLVRLLRDPERTVLDLVGPRLEGAPDVLDRSPLPHDRRSLVLNPVSPVPGLARRRRDLGERRWAM